MAKLSKNPTKTRTIEKNWMREIKRRWKAFVVSIEKALGRMLASNVVNQELPDLPPGYTFDLNPQQQRQYMLFVQGEIDRLLMVTEDAPNWQAEYQLAAYQRGMETTTAQLKAQGITLLADFDEQLAAQSLKAFSAVPSLGMAPSAAVGAGIHRESLEFLYQRSFESLDNVTNTMAQEIRQELFNGLEQGRHSRQVARDIAKRVSVSRSRAELIARTEINQAYGQSAISTTRAAAEELDEEIKLRWITALNERVRPLHRSWHGVLMTPDKAAANKQVSPWNCRCGFAPVIEEADTEPAQTRYDKQRKELEKLPTV